MIRDERGVAGSCRLLETARYGDLLRRIGHVAVGCCDDRLVVVWGGYREADNGPVVYHSPRELLIYDVDLEVWQRVTTAPSQDTPPPLCGATASSYQHQLFLFGGFRELQQPAGDLDIRERVRQCNVNTLYRLDLRSLRWRRLSPAGLPPLPCDKVVSWVYGSRFFVFGGFGVPPPTSLEHRYSHVKITTSHEEWLDGRCWNDQLACYDVATDTWEWPSTSLRSRWSSECRPGPRAAHAAAVVGNCVYVFGGRRRQQRLNDCYRLRLDSMTWECIDDCRGPHHDDTDSGGDSERSSDSDGSRQRRVRRSQQLYPAGRSWHSFTRLNDECLLLYGGFSEHNRTLRDVWLFCTRRERWLRVPARTAAAVLLDPADRRQQHGRMPLLMWHTAVNIGDGEILVVGGINSSVHLVHKDFARDWMTLRRAPKPLRRICLDALVRRYSQAEEPYEKGRMLCHLPESMRNCIVYRSHVGRGCDSLVYLN